MFIERKSNNSLNYIKLNIFLYDVIFGKRKLYRLVQYFCNKFINETQFIKANDLVEYAQKFECDISESLLVSHSEGIALCNINLLKNNTDFEVTPFIIFETENIRDYLKFKENEFMEISIEQSNIFFISNLSRKNEIFLVWLAYQIEKYWNTDLYDNLKKYKTSYSVKYNPNLINNKFSIVKNYINIDFSKKKVSSSKVTLFLKKYLLENGYKTDNQIIKTCLHFDLSPNLVEYYIKLFRLVR